jgi:hemolysin D
VFSAQGRVIPSGRSKVIQPIEAGVVRAIHVRDGQVVKAGDVLLELDPTQVDADRDRLQREVWEAESDAVAAAVMSGMRPQDEWGKGVPNEIRVRQQVTLASRMQEHQARVATLQSELSRRQAEHDSVEASLEPLRKALALGHSKHALREELLREGHIAPAGLIETQMEVQSLEKDLATQLNRLKEVAAGLQTARAQVAQARAEFQAQAQAMALEAARRRDGSQQELVKAVQRKAFQVLRSPIDGVVQQLAVTTIGGVVTQAQPLLTVVPESDALEVEAQVLNRDIGHVRTGQRVITKVETFDFMRYGYIEGEVSWVGTDAVQDDKLGPVYPVRIHLTTKQTPHQVNGRKGDVSAGMSVTADIRTGERRMISYFLAPLLRYKEEALRER